MRLLSTFLSFSIAKIGTIYQIAIFFLKNMLHVRAF